jgi:hypothetical protein
MTLLKSVLLLISLGMIAALLACSSSSSTTTPPPPVVLIAATSGGGQSAAVGAPFANPLTATVTTGGTPTSGVTVTFTSPAATDGKFADGGTPAVTDAEMTNASGVATSTVFTAGTAAGTYNVTASASGAASPAGFSLTNTAGAAATLAATSGSGQSAAISTAFTNPLVAKVSDSNGNGVMGVSVTFTAPATGASGLFADGGTPAATDTEMTDADGHATSTTFTANATSGGPYNVTATSGTLTPVNFSLTNTVATVTTLNPGIYVFSVSGADNDGPYSVAGAFTVAAGGVISGGEQDFIDVEPSTPFLARPLHDAISSSGSSWATSADGNVIFTLNTGDSLIGVAGVETLDATLVSTSRALIVEFDNSATSSGSMDQQTATPAAPSGAYAFYLSGDNPNTNGGITVLGGILDFSSGALTTTASVFDINDSLDPQAYTGQLFASGTVGTTLDPYGRVAISLTPAAADTSLKPQIGLIGYVVGPGHIRLVETTDAYGSVTGGSALGQTGTFTNSALSGSSYVFGMSGSDATFALQTVGVLTLTAASGSSTAGTVSGTLNCNDGAVQNAQGGTAFTGTYTLDTTDPGRITMSNLTDSGATFSYDLQLYLTGDGHAAEISVDLSDWLSGLGYQQTGPFSATTFSGGYALNVEQITTADGFEFDGVGPVTVNGTTAPNLTGFVDFNNNIPPTPDVTLTGAYTVNASGIFTGTITGLDFVSATTVDNFTYYVADSTYVLAIETDATPNQITLAYFEAQQ